MNKIILASILAVVCSTSFAIVNTNPTQAPVPVCKSGATLLSGVNCPSGYSLCKPTSTSKLRVCQKL